MGLKCSLYPIFRIATVSLSATDNALQKTTAYAVVYGDLSDDTSENSDQSTVAVTTANAPKHEENPIIVEPTHYYLYHTSPAEQLQNHIDFLNNANNKPIVSNHKCFGPTTATSSALLAGPLSNGLHKISHCEQKTECTFGAIINGKFYSQPEILQKEEKINQKLLAEMGVGSWQEAKNVWQEAIAQGASGWSLSQPPKPFRYNTYTKDYSITHPPTCEVRYVDILPPVIFNVQYNLSTGKIEADIYDHGAPLEQIQTKLKLQKFEIVPENPGYTKHHGRDYQFLPQTSFNTSTGEFSGTYIDQRLELFGLTIEARDAAHNLGSKTIDVFYPQQPPVVSLQLVDLAGSGKSLNIDGNEVAAQFLGEAWDESGIDHEKTRVRVNHQLIPSSLSLPFDYPVSFQHQESSSWLRVVDTDRPVYRLLFGVGVDEGTHTAQFRVTDYSGYSSEASLDFTLSYKPEIHNFKVSPDSVLDFGGPMFTALILDKGKNLSAEGISFSIDNQPVSRDALYYDPDSGYFCVLGPLELSPGRHNALILAVDTDGNSASQTISFFAGHDIAVSGDTGLDISIESYTIWEIKNQNNDGQANPGETIRLFLSLRNNSWLPTEQCQAVLSSDHNKILVKTGHVPYGVLQSGISSMPMRGFELDIAPDILDATISDPFQANFHVRITCGETPSREIPFRLPIYKPSLPANVTSQVVIEPDRLPASTEASSVTLRGTARSSHSSIDEVTIYINGREVPVHHFDKHTERFEASLPLDPGPNTIEIRAVDGSGASGFTVLFIFCSSAVNVSLEKLPKTTNTAQISVSGRAESSASTISDVSLLVNGTPVDLRWRKSDGTFRAEVQLTPGLNTIVVEATDESGASGRARASIRYESTVSVKLDRLPPSTDADSLAITGSASSTGAQITTVQITNNGTPYSTNYNAATKRFSATVDLQGDGNTIRAEARDETGRTGADSAFINKTSSFVPPRISLTSPGSGGYFVCDPIPVSGTFTAGSSTLESLIVNGPDGCSTPVISGGTFTAECNSIVTPEGSYQVEASILTQEGLTATDVVIIRTGPCW